MKFYILTSKSLKTLQRHAETIPPDKQVVIINSLDDDYVREASQYCSQNYIEYHVTESDGTAATGKNSVMQKFLESDNEYMVQVDGDDQITNFGYLYYTSVAEDDNPPDLICLYNQWQIVGATFRKCKDGITRATSTERMHGWKRSHSEKFHTYSVNRYFKFLRNAPCVGAKPLPREKQWGDYSDETLMSWAKARNWWETFIWKHGIGDDHHRDVFNRMVFYSRKAAELVKFDNELKVGEDTMAYLDMRKHHVDGKINVVRHDELVEMTYLYYYDEMGVSMEDMGIVSDQDMHTPHDFGWVVTLVNYVIDNNIEDKVKSAEELVLEDYE